MLRGDYQDQSLFAAPQGNAMVLLIWQVDTFGIARIIDACSERVPTLAGIPMERESGISSALRRLENIEIPL